MALRADTVAGDADGGGVGSVGDPDLRARPTRRLDEGKARRFRTALRRPIARSVALFGGSSFIALVDPSAATGYLSRWVASSPASAMDLRQSPPFLLMILLCSCQGGKSVAPAPASPASTKATGPAGLAAPDRTRNGQANVSRMASCDDPTWQSASVRHPSGHPDVVVRYPRAWKLDPRAPGRASLTSAGQPFQLVFSAIPGTDQSDFDLQVLDEHSSGRYPVIVPWAKTEEASSYRVFAVKRQTPASELELRYYAGPKGVVVVSTETIGALDSEVSRQCEQVLKCLKLAFN